MLRRILKLAGFALVWVVSLHAAPQQPAAPTPPPVLAERPFLTKYCVTCHNAKLKVAGLTLDKVDVGNVSEDAAVWEKVLHTVRAREMPPARNPRPDEATFESF